MNPLITVVVPIYNVEKYLDKCIESIVNQTYQNLEIILVDDGSPDNCPQMCDEWAEKDNRIKVVHKENGGLSSARNAGIKVCTGEYITFVDSDDYIEPQALDVHYNNIIKDDYDVCVCNVNHVNHNGNIIDSTCFSATTLEEEQILPAFLDTNIFDSSSACSKLYKTSVLLENNLLFDETNKWGEDYPFNYWFFKVAKKMISIEDCLYNYLQGHEGSITDGMTFGRATRWNILKQLLPNEMNNEITYPIALKKYASEILCCTRELLRSGNKELIDECYPLIVTEIKEYYSLFMSKCALSKAVKYSIKLINISPKAFKLLYQIYTR